MRPAFDPAGHRVPRTKPTCLLHTGTPRRRRPFALVLRLHQHQSSRNLHLQYLAKNQSIQRCQSLITPGSDHPPVLEPHMVLRNARNPRSFAAWPGGGFLHDQSLAPREDHVTKHRGPTAGGPGWAAVREPITPLVYMYNSGHIWA
jgi:hypothetical protein